ncbi:hypothetical protein BJ508DRAFT_343243 [Ascobolus immersus RN42]|uniref:Uncharacterized protein n=1 Tax=Ascobolus immersus RN42 TaxID=1160509 RepID=A0A3N4IGH0_ASCIM|nr:hypothetical protein BJ508DRAFT_343243 [Ascobolus immersus RN42]
MLPPFVGACFKADLLLPSVESSTFPRWPSHRFLSSPSSFRQCNRPSVRHLESTVGCNSFGIVSVTGLAEGWPLQLYQLLRLERRSPRITDSTTVTASYINSTGNSSLQITNPPNANSSKQAFQLSNVRTVAQKHEDTDGNEGSESPAAVRNGQSEPGGTPVTADWM